MLRLTLPGGAVTLIDDADQLLIAGFPWRALQTDNSGLVYAHAWNGKMHLYMHRLIAGAGPGEQIDHWNGNGLDNQRHNLRTASYSQQRANTGKQRNRRTNRVSSSQFKGVTWDKNRSRWSVFIGSGADHKNLGRFTDEEIAARAYDAAALDRWGQFARLNFPVDHGLVCGLHRLGILDAPCTCT